jgi:hypothetical protein
MNVMKYIYIILCLLIIITITTSCSEDNVEPSGQEILLKNDSYEKDKNSRLYIPDFMVGEEAAATLGPLDNPYTISQVHFFFGTTGADRETDIILKIYREYGTTNPGNPIFMKRYTLIATNEEILHDIDLSGENLYITDGSAIRVSIQFTNEGLPSIAHEWEGTLTASRNWIKKGGTWITSETIGFDKDFIIRATVTQGVPPIVND